MSTRRSTLTLVVNPNAGRGRARRILPSVTAALVQGMPHMTLRVQQASSFTDAKVRALAAVENSLPPEPGQAADVLVMMGGDGMASVGLNACANTHVRLGVVPAGTGDDFARGMGLATKPVAAAHAIVEGRERKVDLLEARGALTGGAQRRYVGSVVSTGYDAKVNWRTNHRSVSIGRLSYAWDALAELAVFEPLPYRLVIDGVPRSLPAIVVAVGNAGYVGGGMHICPDADPADGLLDLTIVHPVSRFTLVRLLPSLFNGSFVRDPAVERVRARTVRVDGDRMFAMADGEDLGEVPLDLSCAAGALTLLGAVRGNHELNR